MKLMVIILIIYLDFLKLITASTIWISCMIKKKIWNLVYQIWLIKLLMYLQGKRMDSSCLLKVEKSIKLITKLSPEKHWTKL
uniref:Putative secreted protein n=1 Tax=Xenopsylla cheopis TaxID=163159 RepID=A0A6M2E0E3_XENCH